MVQVTLVTPVFNGARFLGRAIESVFAQRGVTIDYRVIDDGSTDGTPAVLAAYAGRLDAVRQANGGQAAALNRGWAGTRAPYLAYLSADDVLAPGAVAAMVARLDADPALVCAYPDCDLIGPDDRIVARRTAGPFCLERLVIEGVNPIGPGAVFRADAMAAVGGWREELVLGADREFWARLAGVGGIAFVPERFAFYRVHARALSRSMVGARRADDLLRWLDVYFARADVPPALRAREAEARAAAHREIAHRQLRAGLVGRALGHLIAARRAPARAQRALGERLRVARALVR